MESFFIIYISIAIVIGLCASAMMGQTGIGAMSFWIMFSIIALPIILVISVIEYYK